MLRKLLLFLLLLALPVLPGGGLAAAQTDEALPPHVIDVWPLPGVELAHTEPLTVTFDQAMDAASVESALAFAPALEGAVAWPDARTLRFTPAEGWPLDVVYTVTIDAAATAENGLALVEPFVFEARTVGPLQVAEVSPSDGAEGVATDARIIVTFNRPVVPLVATAEQGSLPTPITVEPATEGAGEWVSTSIYAFTPATSLLGGAIYTVTAPAGLTSVDGAPLAETFAWTFRTLPPQVLDISPANGAERVRLDEPVVVTFSQPMDQGSTEVAFALLSEGEPVPGAFTWNDAGDELTFTPEAPLRLEGQYVINIAPTALGAGGDTPLTEGISSTFATVPLPGVAETDPANGAVDIPVWRQDAVIEFRSPMNTATVDARLKVEPEPARLEKWWDTDGRVLSLYFERIASTVYTLTVEAGAEDIYGNAIPTDYIFSFTTGPIQTNAYLLNVGRVAVTSAYRDDTRIPMVVTGTPTVNFALYGLDLANIEDAVRGPYWDNTVPVWATREALLREWTQTFDSGGEEDVLRDVNLASESGGALGVGTYYLISRFPAGEGGNLQQNVLIVATANLAVKRTPDETLVWATDIATAEPVAGLTVTIYNNGQPAARGETDADGVFRAPMDVSQKDTFLAIVAEGAGAYGLWTSDYEPQPQTKEGYLYTDRPIYRPGEKVLFRGVIRDKDDMDYSVPNLRTVRVTAGSYWADETYFDGEVEVTDFGTFSGEFVLPEEAAVGDGGYIRVEPDMNYGEYPANVGFTVAEYRVPEYEVTVAAQQDELYWGDALNALAKATYYFGGAVSDANLSWYAYAEPRYFQYTGPGNYNFSDEDRYFWRDLGTGEGVTDASGQYLIATEAAFDLEPDQRPAPMAVTMEATVTDESGQAITGRTTLTVHPADVYVGLRTDRYFGSEGEPTTVELIAVTPESALVPGQRIDLTVEEVRWKQVTSTRYDWPMWEQEFIAVETGQVTTGDDGVATYTFTPPYAGVFRVRATAMDAKERTNSAALRFWVTGAGRVQWGAYYGDEYINLVADKDSYLPGETAEVLIPVPFENGATALVTTERVGIMSVEVLTVEDSTLVYRVPITDESAPTLHVSAVLVQGSADGKPDYRQGSVSLTVQPVHKRLDVTVTPSVTRAQPRDDVSFDVQVTGANGEPVQAEVGLALVDKAILALRPPNSGTLEETFYRYQSDYVTTTVSTYALLDRFEAVRAGGMGGGGGGGGGETPFIREDFEQTPLWAPHVVTGADGRASVSVTLPDNLTTWQLDARSVTRATDVGQTTTEVISTLPLIVRPVTPRFFVAGDRVQLAAVINNNTDDEQTVTARLEAAGVVLEGAAAQDVTIAAGGRARVEWEAVAQDVEYVDLIFFATGADYQDAARPSLATGPDGTIPVYRYTAPDTVGTGGVLREAGARVEGVSLPPRLDAAQGALTVRLDPSIAVTATDAFDYLEDYPHQCVEQTVSRFLPNAATYRALRELGIEDPGLEAHLAALIELAAGKLTEQQNPDGGWGWFAGMESNALVTAYAALGLIEARDAGFTIDAAMLDRALNYVRADLVNPTLDTPAWRLNRQAFYLYVLARDGVGAGDDYAALMGQRQRMSYAGRAYLLMAFDELLPGNVAMDLLVSDLTSAAKLSATGAHWEETFSDWWNWGSDTRTTALALGALIRVTPESDLLPNAVRWLIVARQGDHWQTTQETVWAVLAFTDWMKATGELQADYAYSLTVNGETLAETTVTPATVREGQEVRVAVADLLRDEVNRVTVARGDGAGNLYYTAHLDLRLPASEVDALSRGVTVTREYFMAGEAGEAEPVTGAQMGDIITVRLTLTLPEDVYYFVLEDPIPAGTEGVDTSLLTTSRAVEGPSLAREGEEDPYWYWGWWWFDRTEIRDEQVNLFADYLPHGTYTYTYQLRATVPGEFQTLPAHAYAFYFPEVFGRSDGALFTVEPAPSE